MFGCLFPKIIGKLFSPFTSGIYLVNIHSECRDDGIYTGLLLGPLISLSLLFASVRQVSSKSETLPAGWLIENPGVLQNPKVHLSAAQAALLSRYSLVDLSTLCATILLLHVCASWWIEGRVRKDGNVEGERASVPRSEGRRSWYYILFALGSTVLMVTLKIAMPIYGINLWICE